MNYYHTDKYLSEHFSDDFILESLTLEDIEFDIEKEEPVFNKEYWSNLYIEIRELIF